MVEKKHDTFESIDTQDLDAATGGSTWSDLARRAADFYQRLREGPPRPRKPCYACGLG